MTHGLLLVNLGSPDSHSKGAVRRYLREFLSDKRVIQLPALARYALVYGFILPFRPKSSAKAYASIWTESGSPLLVKSKALQKSLQNRVGDTCQVTLAMRYGQPNLKEALASLSHCDEITVLPLFPQYSAAVTGSILEQVMQLLRAQMTQPTLHLIRDFYQHPRFIQAQAECINPFLPHHDHLLFSYHGLPVNHLRQGPCQALCESACNRESLNHSKCYRAQCLQTSVLLATALNLPASSFTTSFQSRLGRTPWITPYTDHMLPKLADQGVKRLAIACPSFVTDCLETLEEIGMRAREQWLSLGGEELTLVPSLNDNSRWVEAVLEITRHHQITESQTH